MEGKNEMVEEISLNIQRRMDEHINTENDHNEPSLYICYSNDSLKGCNRSYKGTVITTGLCGAVESIIGNDSSSSIKDTYMFDLFRRSTSNPAETMKQCVHMVCAKIDQIGNYYAQIYYGGYNLTYLILQAACFIIEIIQRWSEDKYLIVVADSRNYISVRQVKQDLILLHNQIPFFVLQDIFDCTVKKINPNASLIKLVLSFFKEINPFEPNPYTDDDDYGIDINANTGTSYKHILDLLYKYHQPSHISLDPLSTVTATYSAVDLAKAGVHFKPNEKTEVTIKFKSSWSKCTLTIPVLRIEEHTELLLLSLTSYERQYPEVGNYMASYFYAMMMLVDSKEDLLKLVESKIITNQSGHQHIVDLIHEFAIEYVPVQFIYSKEWREMGNYCNNLIGWTRRTYFSGAWSYIASATALILFIFTAIQTYCSIRNL